MPRLTAQLVWSSPAFVNPLKDRELDLRGNGIAQIENLGATENQFDTIDLSDNQITLLDGFPLLSRLTSIFMNNNKVARVAAGLGESIPALETLVLTNNSVVNLADLDALAEFKKLEMLSLLQNPVQQKKHYRLYLIHKIPSLRVLDFRKVRQREREAAASLFGGEDGGDLEQAIQKNKTAIDADALTPALRKKIQERIKSVKTMAEMSELEHALKTGKLTKELKKQLEQ